MLSSMGRDLKQNVGDQLRGMRHIVRMLGSDTQRPNIAPPALPEAMPELDRLLGRTFRTLDTVLSTVETLVAPVRGSAAPLLGFAPPAAYLEAGDGEEKLCDDLYHNLKAVAASRQSSLLVLKTRLGAVANDFIRQRPGAEIADGILLRLLVHHKPLVNFTETTGEKTVLNTYIAVTLLFSLALRGGLPRSETATLIEDALLLSGTRSDAIASALKGSKGDAELSSLLKGLTDRLA